MNWCDHDCAVPWPDQGYRRVLWLALAINLAMLAIEIVSSYELHEPVPRGMPAE